MRPADRSRPLVRQEEKLLVRFRARVDRPRQESILHSIASEVSFFKKRTKKAKESLQTERSSLFDRFVIVKLRENFPLEAALEQVQRNPEVLYAEPNYHFRIVETSAPRLPNDFDFVNSWGLHNFGQSGGKPGADINATRAWQLGTGNERVVVAIVDTGADYYHPDLSTNIWVNSEEIPGNGIDDDGNGYVDDVYGYDFVSNDGDPMDDHGHGTHVAGIVGAVGDNKAGMAGVCWRVRLMPVKTFDESGEGELAEIIDAIAYAAANGAHIINASWGSDIKSRALEEAIAEANRAGLLVIAAAGNERTDRLFYPAACEDVIAVAATGASDQRAMFSNFGSHIDVAAPGDNIYSTLPNNAYGFLSGTSMAAPYVSGLAALILSNHPEFSNRQVENIIRNSVDTVETDHFIGAGRINAFHALQVNAPLPVALLKLPETITGDVSVLGTASAENFGGYTLYYGKGKNPTNWTEVYRSTAPISDGVLLQKLSTAPLEEGVYTFQLVARNGNGQLATDRVGVNVRNVKIASPMHNDLLRAGEKFDIRGTVFGANRTYKIQWGVGMDPTHWQDNGITLANEGAKPVLDSILGSWDTQTLATNEFYALKLTAKADGNIVGEDIVRMVYLDGQLKKGWPRYLPVVGDYPVADWRHITVADLDSDGDQELILVDHANTDGQPAHLLVFCHNGEVIWSRELASGPPYSDVPVVGDIDNDGRMEIFVDAGEKGELHAFRFEGTRLDGNWPVKLDATNLGKVMADLDGDGFNELIGFAQTPYQKDGADWRQLVVIGRHGTITRKWDLPAGTSLIDVPKIFPAVGNLDADPDLEIVTLFDGQSLAAFSLKNPKGPLWTVSVDGTLTASPVIGDLNHDGTNEVIVAAWSNTNSLGGGLYAFDNSGRRLLGWPVLVNEAFSASPALADVDGDGTLEISMVSSQSQKLHLITHRGFEMEGWPIANDGNLFINSSSVIGDIDGDGKLDIVVSSLGYWFLATYVKDLTMLGGIRAWNHRGTALDLNPHPEIRALVMESFSGTSWLKSAPVTLTDLDGNGKLDVIAASIQDRAYAPLGEASPIKNRSSLYVWELNAPFDPQAMPWPTLQHDAQHSGAFRQPARSNQSPMVLDIPDQIVPTGRNFYSIDLDRYVEDPDHSVAALQWRVTGNRDLKVVIGANNLASVLAPSSSWTGQETIDFIATDPSGASHYDSATFEVRSNYDPPVAHPDACATPEDTTVNINVVANDSGPREANLTVTHVSKPKFGSAKLNAEGAVLYSPPPDFNGIDRFSYAIGDGRGGMNMTSVTVQVLPANDPPIANSDQAITSEDASVSIDVLANDQDVDGDAIQLVQWSKPEHGSVSPSSQGTLTYSPDADFNGLDHFIYTIRDPSSVESSGTVTVMVKPVNDPPTAKNQSFMINKNASLNLEFLARDVEEDKLTFMVITAPTNGVLMAFPTVASYFPKKDFVGTDRFTYKANDGRSDGQEATVTVTMLDANNPPEVIDQSLKTKPGQPLPVTLAAVDADEDQVSFEIMTSPQMGSLVGRGSNYVYRPKPGILGDDQFAFQAFDGHSTSQVATVSVTITDVNSAPIARDSWIETKMNLATNLMLLASDPEADALTFQIVVQPINGQLSGAAPALDYTPDSGFVGSDRVTFKVSDGEFESSVATVSVGVKFPNHPPNVNDQSVSAVTNQSAALSLTATDADSDVLKTAILKGPQNGTLAGIGTRFVYVPKPGFTGSDSFTYKVWDGHAYSKIGKVSITVTPGSSEERPEFDSTRWLTSGEVLLRLKTQPGRNFSIETSTNLLNWIPFNSGMGDGSTISFTDTNAPSLPHRFYRASQAAP